MVFNCNIEQRTYLSSSISKTGTPLNIWAMKKKRNGAPHLRVLASSILATALISNNGIFYPMPLLLTPHINRIVAIRDMGAYRYTYAILHAFRERKNQQQQQHPTTGTAPCWESMRAEHKFENEILGRDTVDVGDEPRSNDKIHCSYLHEDACSMRVRGSVWVSKKWHPSANSATSEWGLAYLQTSL